MGIATPFKRYRMCGFVYNMCLCFLMRLCVCTCVFGSFEIQFDENGNANTGTPSLRLVAIASGWCAIYVRRRLVSVIYGLLCSGLNVYTSERRCNANWSFQIISIYWGGDVMCVYNICIMQFAMYMLIMHISVLHVWVPICGLVRISMMHSLALWQWCIRIIVLSE